MSLRVVLICFGLTSAVCLRSEIFNFKFSGIITDADVGVSSLDDSITNGSSFTGFYTFDSAVLDSETDPTVGDYRYTNAACGVVVKAGNYVFRTSPLHVDFIIETVNRTNGDSYLFRSSVNVASDGICLGDIEWQIYDPSATAWNNDALPTVPPNLNALSDGVLAIHGGNFSLSGPVQSIGVNSLVLTNPPAATIYPAVELNWPAVFGYFYQVQESTNMVTWSNRGDPILSKGDPVSLFVRQQPLGTFFRLLVLNHGE